MPGYTKRWQFPYVLATDALCLVANVTQLLAERLDAIISSGELNGVPGPVGPRGEPGPPGDQRPTASVTCGTHELEGYTAWTPTWVVETDLNAPNGAAQATPEGLTVHATGVYLLTAQMPWEGAASGESLMCKVYAAGEQILEATKIATTWENVSVICGLVPLTVGQRITLSLIHSGHNSITVGGPIQGGVEARLAMTRMA